MPSINDLIFVGVIMRNVEYDKNMAHATEYDVERTYECYMKMLGRKIINNK